VNAIGVVIEGLVFQSQFDRVADTSEIAMKLVALPPSLGTVQSSQWPEVEAPPHPLEIWHRLNRTVLPSGEKRGQ
jgi:hypothetical protein